MPLNAYFTPNRWLNPINVGKTKEELDVLLSDLLFFDFDILPYLEDFRTLKQVQLRIIEFIDYISDAYNKNPYLIIFSGEKGFHLYYKNFFEYEISKFKPNERLSIFSKSRQNLIEEIPERFKFDYQVTLDPYRIMRIPNSINGNSLKQVTIIKELRNYKI